MIKSSYNPEGGLLERERERERELKLKSGAIAMTPKKRTSARKL